MVRATGRAVVFDSRAHLVSKYEVVYTSDPPARINDDRIQLIQNAAVNFSRCGVWPGAEAGNRRQRPNHLLYPDSGSAVLPQLGAFQANSN
jgi:hypothetical protein